MKRSDITPMPAYFDRYINLADDKELSEVLQTSLEELDRIPLDTWVALGNNAYAPGKWTVKDTIQHLIDTERIFAYRALCFARADATIQPSYDEAFYASNSNANARELADLIAELKIVRQSFIALFASFTDTVLRQSAVSFKGTYSVLSIGFIIPGHQRHHFRILEEKYLPLLK
jgi:hypothetical protein